MDRPITRTMPNDQLQTELDRYYSYGTDTFVRYTHRLRINEIQKLIIEIANCRVRGERSRGLDAGCSYGVYSIMLAEAGYDVIGIDIDRKEIDWARRWARERELENKITFQLGDLHKLSFRDGTFDLVVCSEVLEHLDDSQLGASELFRILRPNGMAIISMPNIACLFGMMQWAYRKTGLRSLLGKPPLNLHQIQHSRYWFGNIIQLLKASGFAIEKTCSTSHVPYLWTIDEFLGTVTRMPAIASKVDTTIARLPVVKYLGFNFIITARKLSLIHI